MTPRILIGTSAKTCRAALVLVTFLTVAACTPQEARVRLKEEIPADSVEIIHARFPCRSPEAHFFGYRFRIFVNKEVADGDVCWNLSSGKWSWYILPEYTLARLNAGR